MKKLVLVALIAALISPVSAQAAETKFTGAPLTNVESQGATINIMLLGVPSKGGLYIQQCVEAAAGTRPTVCNEAVQLWISTLPRSSFLPTDVIKFKPTGTFATKTAAVDCTVSKCGIFLRFDHTVPGDLSEDQFIPLTFKAATSTTVVLPVDEITATINGVAVSTQAPITLSYRQLGKVAATSKSGAVLTYATEAAACALNGTEITPLSGTGQCAISVTSAGNATATGVTVILPIRLVQGKQTLGDFTVPRSAKSGSRVALPTVTNFGEKITYKAQGACTVSSARVTFKKGSCTLTATAPAKKSSYSALNTKFVIAGK
jgi:hypothetical protein